MESICTDSNRLCIVKMTGVDFKVLIVNVYMAVNGGTYKSYEEFGNILNEISGILNIYDNFDIIIGGDFNVDFRVNSLNLMLLNSFVEDEDLNTINNYMSNPNSFSYESNMGNKSLIDHFFISNNIKNKIGSCDILINESNLSDHNPIFLHLNIFSVTL